MRAAPAALLLAMLALAACAGPAPPPADDAEPVPAPTPTRFVALGDTGTGRDGQHRVAAAVASVCAARGCDFAVLLGDNIYDHGASSPDDPQFDTKFEQPYASLAFPFYAVLGNHDNSGDPASADPGLGTWTDSGDHQVAYAQRTDRASDKFRMPGRHYELNLGHVWLLGLDTNTLLHDGTSVSLRLERERQEDFVPRAFGNASAAWRLALGHHPYVSNGPHGNAGAYDGLPQDAPLSGQRLKEFFDAHVCGAVDLYLAGHDHNLQWLEPVPSCGATAFVVSGGGGAGTYAVTERNPSPFSRQTLGFWWFEATPDALVAQAYDDMGSLLFGTTLRKPPASGPA